VIYLLGYNSAKYSLDDVMYVYFLGVPCLRRSACYGLRYRFGAAHFATQTLRMPNAKEVFFMGLMGLPTRPPTSENEVKNTSFLLKNLGFLVVFTRAGLRPALVTIRKLFKSRTTSKILNELFYLVFA